MSQTLKPLHNRVVVKPDQPEQKTAGGLYIPDSAQKKPQQGTIIATGPGTKDEPMTLKKGDKVIYGEYSGTAITTPQGEKYLIMRETDIFATL